MDDDDNRCYVAYLCDDDEPDGERCVGLIYGTRAAQRRAQIAADAGICLLIRPYESVVKEAVR